MDDTSKNLENETIKWLEKLRKELNKPGIKEIVDVIKEKLTREMIKNMNAYVEDCQHFLDKKDFIRAFEAIIYAWGIFETLKHMRFIK